jgi:hypothetical protein
MLVIADADDQGASGLRGQGLETGCHEQDRGDANGPQDR